MRGLVVYCFFHLFIGFYSFFFSLFWHLMALLIFFVPCFLYVVWGRENITFWTCGEYYK
ncbi:hypothetical protein BDZ91DRAFT_718663 [Kalaharituber pfeilii]|nr:hypothetical protein BDZ91DRAFT_718663 [Kalaharituber pfeilii]